MQVRAGTESDLPAIRRIWEEVGWVEDDDDAAHIEPFLADAAVVAAELDGEAEASGSVHRGTLRHGDDDLDLAVVSSITTSRVGRKQGLARAVLDRLVLDAAADGAAVAILGMFEQGFYDGSGFGTGSEMLFHRLDPASLSADLPYRRPLRLTTDDAAEIAATLATRARGHGGVAIPSAAMRRAELEWADNGFGLGYRDDDGTLTHFVWMSVKGEHGPYRVHQWAWQDVEQLRELLGVIRSLGDQVRWVSIPEPWCLQLQTLIDKPGRQYLLTKGTEHHYKVDADAWWQARILDLPACMRVLRGRRAGTVRVSVTDPLSAHGFDAVAGDWTIGIDEDGASATRGFDGEASLACSVNTLTRLWLGVRRPSTVLATDGVVVADDTASALDAAVILPRPDVGHDF